MRRKLRAIWRWAALSITNVRWPCASGQSSVGVGGSCSRDSQCKMGSCDNNGVCQCTKDADCGSGGNWSCNKGTLGVGRNVCVDSSVKFDVGAQCMRDNQC